MSEAEEKARKDIFEAISEQVTKLKGISSTAIRSRALADLALAYRYADGGAQPGSVSIEK